MEGCNLIDASFGTKSREATVSGAYQYDVGQRLRLTGLPSEEELKAQDEMLAEDSVIAVAVQFAFKGDDRTEERSAFWSDEEQAWTVEIPDVYLQRSADVLMYVVVSHGATDEASRAKTVYEAVFRPISRPAPGTAVSPAVRDDWAALRQEVTAAITAADEAVTGENGANSAASKARDAAAAANEAAEKATSDVNAYLQKLGDTQVSLEIIGLSETPTVEVEDVAGADNKTHKKVIFRLPQSVVTVNGQAAGEGGDIKLTPDMVGAMPATHQTVFEFASEIPTTGWKTNSDFPYCEVTLDGVTANDAPVVDVRKYALNTLSAAEIKKVLAEWAKVVSIEIYDGWYRVNATKIPSVPIPIKLLCVR